MQKSQEQDRAGDCIFRLALNIGRSSVWNLRHIILQPPRIVKWIIDLLENLSIPAFTYVVNGQI